MALFTTVIVVAVLKLAQDVFIPLALAILCTFLLAPMVSVLNELTRVVPDGSWLLSLSIKGREIILDGLSPSAATIALALQHDPLFSDISFRSPISRDPGTGLEHFQLGATLAEGTK